MCEQCGIPECRGDQTKVAVKMPTYLYDKVFAQGEWEKEVVRLNEFMIVDNDATFSTAIASLRVAENLCNLLDDLRAEVEEGEHFRRGDAEAVKFSALLQASCMNIETDVSEQLEREKELITSYYDDEDEDDSYEW